MPVIRNPETQQTTLRARSGQTASDQIRSTGVRQVKHVSQYMYMYICRSGQLPRWLTIPTEVKKYLSYLCEKTGCKKSLYFSKNVKKCTQSLHVLHEVEHEYHFGVFLELRRKMIKFHRGKKQPQLQPLIMIIIETKSTYIHVHTCIHIYGGGFSIFFPSSSSYF